MTEARKLNLRLPAELYTEAAATAEAMGISLNAFLTLAARNWVQYQRRSLMPPPVAAASTKHLPNVGRNEPCPCGSGRKSKHCHGKG